MAPTRVAATLAPAARGLGSAQPSRVSVVSSVGSSFFAGDLSVRTSGSDDVAAGTVMAVPKKGTSKTKTRIRRAVWKGKARVAALKALSLGASILTGRGKFIYKEDKEEPIKTEEEK